MNEIAQTTRGHTVPTCFSETAIGLLFAASGMNEMRRWDGLTSSMELVGLTAPKTAPVIASGTGVTGTLVGDYFCFMRYLDRYGNFSNLSPLSNKLSALNASGTITGATNAVPIVVTTAQPHGLVTGLTVQVKSVQGNAAANGTWKVTVVNSSSFKLDNSAGSGDYRGGGTWLSGTGSIIYSSLETPSEQKVAKRQLLRSTSGQATTFYVDIETTDLTSTSLTSTKTDDQLKAGSAVPLLDSKGNDLAVSRFSRPPNHKAVIANHLDRMFAATDIEYTRGNVAVTLGSTTVTGVGTEWTQEMAGRMLYVSGNDQEIEISSVNAIAQTLLLKSAFQGNTNAYADYAIVPARAERRLTYFSEAGLPEAWPPTNAFSIQPDGDELTGLMSKASFLYILERNHIYRFSFRTDPAEDGYVFLVANRGCVNNRCWVVVEDIAYMLDEGGIHAFSGDDQPISLAIRDIFNPTSGSKFLINWRASRFFHASHSPAEETIRWFVALGGNYTPRHAICYDYRQRRWWIELYPGPTGASCTGLMTRRQQVFIGSEARRVMALGAGPLDGPDVNAGTLRGTATSAARFSLTDSAASFTTGTTLIGVPVAIVSGRGKGQIRVINSVVSATQIAVGQPWLVTPDSTSVYQIGGVPWLWRSGWLPLEPSEGIVNRTLELAYMPTPTKGSMDFRLRTDHDETLVPSASSYDDGSVKVAENSTVVEIATDDQLGLAQLNVGGRSSDQRYGPRYASVELSGVSMRDRQSIYELRIRGMIGQ